MTTSESKNMSQRPDIRPQSSVTILFAKINHFTTYLVMSLSSYYNDMIINIFFSSISTPSFRDNTSGYLKRRRDKIQSYFHQKVNFKIQKGLFIYFINDYLYRDDKSTLWCSSSSSPFAYLHKFSCSRQTH